MSQTSNLCTSSVTATGTPLVIACSRTDNKSREIRSLMTWEVLPEQIWHDFIFCWPCISLQILANNQLDAPFHVFIYFISLPVSSITVLIIRRSNCINTSSGMISLCKWLLGMPVGRELTHTNHTRWCINTIRSPDDERCDARNMQRDEINKYMKKCVKLVISKNLKIRHSLRRQEVREFQFKNHCPMR